MVATAILMIVMVTVFTTLLSTESHVRSASARQRAVEQSRRLADILTSELRDVNLTATDFLPAAPLEEPSIQFRKVVGYDPVTGVVLSPTRASGEFCRIAHVGDRVIMEIPGLTFTLAEGVTDLHFTLTPPNLLTIHAQIETSNGEKKGSVARTTLDLVIALKNQLP